MAWIRTGRILRINLHRPAVSVGLQAALNGRVTEIRDVAGITNREWQLIGFPFQFVSGRSWYDWLFIGGGLRQMTRQPDAPSLIGGAIGQLGAVRIVVGGHWDFERDEARLLLTGQYFL